MAAYTEVTSQGWFSRIGESIKGVLVGLVLVLISLVLLFWNEGRAVKETKKLELGEAGTVSVAADKVDPANEGKLVHVTGDVKTTGTVADSAFGVQAAEVLRLVRTVEMYQWREKAESKTERKVGGSKKTTTTYTYHETWSEGLIDSSKFKDPAAPKNPAAMAYRSQTFQAPTASVGAFKLNAGQIGRAGTVEPLALADDAAARVSAKIGRTVKLQAGALATGTSLETPAIGDLRITFKVARPGPASIISQQVRDTFAPFATEYGSINLLRNGTVAAAAMYQSEHSKNTLMTWGLRLLCLVLMFVGVSLIFRPLVIVADVVPFFGDILGVGVGLLALAIALPLSLLTIAIAWLFYRPLLGVGLLVVAAAVVVAIKKLAAAKKKAATAPPATPA